MDNFINMIIAAGYPALEPVLDANIQAQATAAGTKLGQAVAASDNPWDNEGVEKLSKAARAFADAADAALAAGGGTGDGGDQPAA